MEGKRNIMIASLVSCFIGAAIVMIVSLYLQEEVDILPQKTFNDIKNVEIIPKKKTYIEPKIQTQDLLKNYCDLVNIYADSSQLIVYTDQLQGTNKKKVKKNKKSLKKPKIQSSQKGGGKQRFLEDEYEEENEIGIERLLAENKNATKATESNQKTKNPIFSKANNKPKSSRSQVSDINQNKQKQ